MKTIQQTTEFMDACVALAVRTVANLKDDGKVSFTEGLGYIADLGTIRTGFAGISEIPAEFADLDSAESQALRNKIILELDKAGVTDRIQDIADKVLEWVYFTVQTALFIKNAPPTAIKVEE